MKIYVTPYESIDPSYCALQEDIRIDEDGTFIGKHNVCGGSVTVHDVAEQVRAMACECCGLRVLFPKTLKTVADLDRWAKQSWPMPVPEYLPNQRRA
jgi:hypothetical protein